ncbi:MAG: trypsin-like peptidase domain-containing protein [Deltaproteobacteria bacterium]|nr:trypsin-like peptidase domain-containing protein [Deltaproteobacteria bacterium]
MYQSVVRIFATTQEPDHQCPWQAEPPQHGTGSGVILGKGKILTGAHVVANATFLQVQKVSDPDKVIAEVEAINHDCDLALLSVKEPRFMQGVKPERLGPLPRLRDAVSVVGYPIGGEEISITEGVVSRIEVQRYSHSERKLLAVTVDAAINAGNSGGPVFKDGRVAGIAFQSLVDAENAGEMVPSNLIRRFLEGTKAGKAPTVPGLGLVMQRLENPLLRKRVGLGPKQSGLLVVGVEWGSSAFGHVEVGDAVLTIDGHRVANNGTVQYEGRIRTGSEALLGDHFVGDVISLKVLRRGRVQDLRVELKPYVALVPRSQYDTPPRYFVFAGLVFQPLTLDYLRTWPEWWEKAPPELLHHYYGGTRTKEREEVVVLTQVLADPITVGFEGLDNTCVSRVAVGASRTPARGIVPRNLAHLVELLEEAKDVIEIQVSEESIVTIDPVEAREANARILERYHIRRDRSRDLHG